ncbi:hypothetical protein T03_17115, partial [Trichinella britovi]
LHFFTFTPTIHSLPLSSLPLFPSLNLLQILNIIIRAFWFLNLFKFFIFTTFNSNVVHFRLLILSREIKYITQIDMQFCSSYSKRLFTQYFHG